jgi:hypothetical protein
MLDALRQDVIDHDGWIERALIERAARHLKESADAYL